MKLKSICYFVEGQDEKKLIDTLKTDLQLIKPGKVYVVNPVQDKISHARLMPLKMGTTVVLVFDTDTDNSTILRENIRFVSSKQNITKVLCITQVRTLEDELLRSCGNIRRIRELTNSKTDREYKADLIHISNLADRLMKAGFQPELFWKKSPEGAFKDIKNNAGEIYR